MTRDAAIRSSRRRTTAAALAAAAFAASWAVVAVAGHLGGGAAEAAFIAAMVIFALGECLLSPTLPAIINDLAPPGAAGRYNGLGTLAFTTGFLLGPVAGGAALAAGWGARLFAVLAVTCALAAAAALRLARHLPSTADHIPAPATSQPEAAEGPLPAQRQPTGRGTQPGIPPKNPRGNYRTVVIPSPASPRRAAPARRCPLWTS